MANIFEGDQRKFLLAVLAGGLIALFLIHMIIADIIGRSRQADVRILSAETDLKSALTLWKDRGAAEQALRAAEPYFLPAGRDARLITEDLLREVERLAKESGVSVLALSPQAQATASRSASFRASLRLEATSPQLLQFLQGVATSRMLIRIARMSFTVKDEQGSALRGDMVIELNVE